MSKHWKPGRQTVALPPSRIRRDPVRPSRIAREPVPLQSKADLEKAAARSREREIWGGVAGVLFFAVAIAAVSVAIGAATYSLFKFDPVAAAQSARFDQCYSANGPNCVLDGDTIHVRGEKVEIAGIEAPAIDGARCPAERSRGIEATLRLADLLNSGTMTASRAFREPSGRVVRKVQVDGEDVGKTMVAAGVAREIGSSEPNWCAPAEQSSDSEG